MHIWQLKVRRPAYKVMYLQTKPNEEIKDPWFFSYEEKQITFTKMIRIFHVEIDIY